MYGGERSVVGGYHALQTTYHRGTVNDVKANQGLFLFNVNADTVSDRTTCSFEFDYKLFLPIKKSNFGQFPNLEL